MITVEINQYDQPSTLAVICGGGPSPGMNAVIRALTIQAKNYSKIHLKKYLRVIGFMGGFKSIIKSDPKQVKYKELDIGYTSRIHYQGGSILRTSRTSPLKHLKNVVENLIHYNVRYLVTIGGDGTALCSAKIAEEITKLGKTIQVVHVPKTIDNDLPLPEECVTFGFETAKDVGSRIVQNLIIDAKTGRNYHIIVTMGRNTGHLAFGISKSSGSGVCIIPEDYNKEKFKFKHLLTDIELSILKKAYKRGHHYGIVIIAEGFLTLLKKSDLIDIFGKESILKDENNLHMDLGKIDIGDFIRDQMRNRIAAINKSDFHSYRLGYELRCAPPNAFDIDYCQILGFGASNFLLKDKGSHAMITYQKGKIVPMPFSTIMDTKNNKTRIREVNVNNGSYIIGQSLMMMNRFQPEDLEDKELMKQIKIPKKDILEFLEARDFSWKKFERHFDWSSPTPTPKTLDIFDKYKKEIKKDEEKEKEEKGKKGK